MTTLLEQIIILIIVPFLPGNDTSGCVELLLRHEADNNLQDSVGCTPFHLAMLEKSVLIAPILLRAGTDLTIK